MIVGIRPSDLEDAEVWGTSGSVLEVEVDITEELGSEVNVLFTVDAPPVTTRGSTRRGERRRGGRHPSPDHRASTVLRAGRRPNAREARRPCAARGRSQPFPLLRAGDGVGHLERTNGSRDRLTPSLRAMMVASPEQRVRIPDPRGSVRASFAGRAYETVTVPVISGWYSQCQPIPSVRLSVTAGSRLPRRPDSRCRHRA